MTDNAQPARLPPWASYATLALVMLFWSGNFIVGRVVQGHVPPLTLALFRWAGAAVLLAPFAWRHLIRDWPVLTRHWRIVLVLGLSGVAAFNAFVYTGLQFTTATNGILLQAAIPPLVLLCNLRLFGERSKALQIAGCALSMLGVVIVVLRGNPSAITHLGLNIGDLLILGGVIGWAVYTSLLRLRPPVHPLAFLFATFLIGVVAMAPLSAMEFWNGERLHLDAPTFGALAYVAVFPSLIAYILYNAAVRDLGAGAAGQTITLLPLFGAFLAAAMLGEALHGFHAVGMGAILGGILLTALAGRKA
jgi:drug/metabolite transporter (DMT)-like permease